MSSIGEIAKFRTSIQTDTINEFTSAAGVTVDGVLLKDAAITASGAGKNTFVSSSPFIHIKDTSTGDTSIANGMAGIELTAAGHNTTSKFTPAIKFGTTDDELTTINPKFGAIIVGEAAETYSSDLTGGMNLAFYTQHLLPGASGNLQEVGKFRSTGYLDLNTAARTIPTALTTTVPIALKVTNSTYTDNVTAASGTVVHGTVVSFDNPAIAATNGSVVYTNASTLYVDGAPTAGSNVTITNPYALYVASGKVLVSNSTTESSSIENFRKSFTYTHSGTSSATITQSRNILVVNQNTYNNTVALTTGGGGPRCNYASIEISGSSGTVTAASCYVSFVDNSGAGTLTNGVGFNAQNPTNSGTFSNYYAFYAEASTAAGTNYAFYADNAASGTARYNFYANGTAPNVFYGAITTPRTTLTASATGSGAITVINNYHAVSGAGGAASTITTINGGIDGMMLVLKAVSDTVDISFATGGNILLDGGATFTCDTLNDTITLIYDGSLTKWLEIGRCNNS